MTLTSKMIKEIFKKIPNLPGVYLMKDHANQVIYIGKAKSLKKRVSSYFTKTINNPWTKEMVGQVEDIETIRTANELEALMLEASLINSYQPKYNIKLRDNKSFPFLYISGGDFPYITITRHVSLKQGKYYGPYLNRVLPNRLLDIARRHFGVRTCREKIGENKKLQCLDMQIGLCSGPCQNLISREEYQENIDRLVKIINGEFKGINRDLSAKMEKVAQEEKFEQAARLRDQIQIIESIAEEQRVFLTDLDNKDIIGLYQDNGQTVLEVVYYRDGHAVDQKHIFLEHQAEGEEIISSFLTQFYSQALTIPSEVILPLTLKEKKVYEKWLSQIARRRVTLVSPQKGEKKKLLDFANSNAFYHWDQAKKAREAYREVKNNLKDILGLKQIPQSIEAFDISNIGSNQTVGAMVRFEDGMPVKEKYRMYQIRTVKGQNDVAMMGEIIYRRLKNKKLDYPDLILIDGGKPQLNMALKVAEGQGVEIGIISLAKKEEMIYQPGVSKPLNLELNSKELLYLRKIRDEVHRFVIAYHRLKRGKEFLK